MIYIKKYKFTDLFSKFEGYLRTFGLKMMQDIHKEDTTLKNKRNLTLHKKKITTCILKNRNPSSITVLVKNIEYNKKDKRTMFGSACKTTNRIYNQNLHSIKQERLLSAFAGKSKITKSTQQSFGKQEMQEVINNHAQYVTDFNLIYENTKDIHLYQIGTLFTDPTKDSYNISKEKNYKFENSTQQIKFLKQPLKVISDVHIVKNSKKYFDNSNIRQKVEDTSEYKEMFNKVLEELKNKDIKFKVAETPKELEQTGFNVLCKLNPIQEKNTLLETLSFKKHDKE